MPPPHTEEKFSTLAAVGDCSEAFVTGSGRSRVDGGKVNSSVKRLGSGDEAPIGGWTERAEGELVRTMPGTPEFIKDCTSSNICVDEAAGWAVVTLRDGTLILDSKRIGAFGCVTVTAAV